MSDAADQRAARPGFADRSGMIGPYGVRYSWAYWVVIAAAFALLIYDLVDDGAQWANLGVIVLIVVAIVLQPGGLRGPRHAAREQKGRGAGGAAG